IKGTAAAAIEGVKGYYTAGFTFVDNLTGGKLTAIKDKFSQGIQNIKNKITDSISWFKNSGKKIMDTFTEGIKSALNKPVDMVKDALQKIRNMLPFSDAKEGPLSSLTLSGSRVLSTMAEGIRLTENLPAQEVETALGKVDLTLQKNNRKEETESPEESESPKGEPGGQTARYISINNLNLNVGVKEIDELKKLIKFFEEIQDNIHSNGSDAPGPA
ncbi:MAG: phage tail tape measure protein, partial [Lachnospiraceae bacterium]|nr:phage tail tape measure protein [Lachnospiraceae bacterium]